MIFHSLIIALLLAWTAWAQTPADQRSLESATNETEQENYSDPMPDSGDETLSTELLGVDSLNVVPKVVATPYEGGTRRIELESTVFRRESPFVYNSAGRRDPFRALIVDEKKEGEIQTDLLIVEGATLTGIVWAENQYLAMIRDKDNRTFFLREGDAVYSGSVSSVTQSQAVFEISTFGDYRRVTLKVNG